jgi:hypothetical protein
MRDGVGVDWSCTWCIIPQGPPDLESTRNSILMEELIDRDDTLDEGGGMYGMLKGGTPD